MRFDRWTNPSLPQTLQLGMFLLYADAVLGLLFGAFVSPIGLVLVVGSALAAVGIANTRRWAYTLGVVMAIVGLLPFVYVAIRYGIGDLLRIDALLSLIFPLIEFLALIHPQSRDYQKIWFS